MVLSNHRLQLFTSVPNPCNICIAMELLSGLFMLVCSTEFWWLKDTGMASSRHRMKIHVSMWRRLSRFTGSARNHWIGQVSSTRNGELSWFSVSAVAHQPHSCARKPRSVPCTCVGGAFHPFIYCLSPRRENSYFQARIRAPRKTVLLLDVLQNWVTSS